MARMLVVLLLCILAGLGNAGAPAGVVYSTRAANIQGDTLVLDVGSLFFQGNHPVFPPFTEAKACEARCAGVPGCNAWTFCGNKNGCGSGCSAYVKTHPALPVNPGNPTEANPSWKLPLTGFGPHGQTAGCARDTATFTPGDKWPYGLCSLKQLPAEKLRSPGFWSTNPNEGWQSGWIQAPAQCAVKKGAGLVSARACGSCLGSKNPAACIACASGAPRDQIAAIRGVSASIADGCGTCYGLSANPSQCLDCIRSNKACGKCALQPSPTGSSALDVAACISCTLTRGDRYLQPCSYCAAAKNKAACNTCLTAIKPNECDPKNQTLLYTFNSGCWNPSSDPGLCQVCSDTAANASLCTASAAMKPYSSDVQGCAFVPASDQAHCYACRAAAKSPVGSCANCFSDIPSYKVTPFQKQRCVDCAVSKKVVADAKLWCWSCGVSWYDNSQEPLRKRCFACLQSKQSDYLQACGRLT